MEKITIDLNHGNFGWLYSRNGELSETQQLELIDRLAKFEVKAKFLEGPNNPAIRERVFEIHVEYNTPEQLASATLEIGFFIGQCWAGY